MPPGAGDFIDIGHLEQTASGFFADYGYCSTCENDGLIWGVDAFNTIQDAVDAAQSDLAFLRPDEPLQFTVGVGEGARPVTGTLDSGARSGAQQTASGHAWSHSGCVWGWPGGGWASA